MLTTRKAQELDVVELTEDLPEFGLKKGEMGTVVVAFDNPDEAYDLEFVDESGKSRFAYAVKPNQIRSAGEAAKEAFSRGAELFNKFKRVEAERELKRAIELEPAYLGTLHNAIIDMYRDTEYYEERIRDLRFILRLNPAYEYARTNLAIAVLNYGIHEAEEEKFDSAIALYYSILPIEAPLEIVQCIRQNLSAAYTSLVIQRYLGESSEDSLNYALTYLTRACETDPNPRTRHNLAVIHARFADFYMRNQNPQQALPFFEAAEMAGLIAPDLINDYGTALAAIGRLHEAVAAFERASDLDSENNAIKTNLSVVRRAMEEGEEKVEFMTEEIEIEFLPVLAGVPQDYRLTV